MDYYSNIKDYLVRNEINHRVKDYSKNRSDLDTYYNVGKMIVLAQGGETRAKYGDRLIKEYSERLTMELGRGYSTRNLKRMRNFYLIIQKGTPLVAQLSWSHYIILMSLKDVNEINYYINQVKERNLSKRELQQVIKNKEYERLDESSKQKLIQNEKLELVETIKNPIIITNPTNKDIYKEKVLGDLIMEDLDNFLKELGTGYYYVGREYQIKEENKIYKIDFLLYNVEFNSYIVIELKIGELKHSHIGQLELYMNYIDKNQKKNYQNKTIGIILCKQDNKLVMKYCSNPNIITREYILTEGDINV